MLTLASSLIVKFGCTCTFSTKKNKIFVIVQFCLLRIVWTKFFSETRRLFHNFQNIWGREIFWFWLHQVHLHLLSSRLDKTFLGLPRALFGTSFKSYGDERFLVLVTSSHITRFLARLVDAKLFCWQTF